jgi:nucleotide-binding universal stress UspA family protein
MKESSKPGFFQGISGETTRILLAVDDSPDSERAVRYVGSLLRETQHVDITLFHVLKPMPRELLEHWGSENPAVETDLGKQLRTEQESWVRTEGALEYPILVKALDALARTGFPIERVTLKFGHEDNIVKTVLDEARAGGYSTIVVSRHRDSTVKRFWGGGVSDHLLKEANGFAVWVVE